MSASQILTRLHQHVASLLRLGDHPEARWNVPRARFLHSLVAAVAGARDVMITELVRALPRSGDIKHQYKNFDRMLGEVDLVPLARAQIDLFGPQVGKGGDWVIPIDLSDIHKKYAVSMEALGRVRDGSTGELSVPGYGLATACAVDISSQKTPVPIPLNFEVFSYASQDFVSQPHIWLQMIENIAAHTPGGTFALDREADAENIIGRMLDLKRHFVVRMDAGASSRMLRLPDGRRLRVQDIVPELECRGEIEATRITEEGSGSPYLAEVYFTPVKMPKRAEQLYLCVFFCRKYKEAMVLMTTHPVRTLPEAGATLARYFARWTIEELHRFAKQSFRLENIRTLTYHRLQNIVSAVAMVLGALGVEGQLPGAEAVLRMMEKASGRVAARLRAGQFWGYALLDGFRASILQNPLLLRRNPWLYRYRPDRQLRLFGA